MQNFGHKTLDLDYRLVQQHQFSSTSISANSGSNQEPNVILSKYMQEQYSSEREVPSMFYSKKVLPSMKEMGVG
jgi:hypothetical protein